MTDLRPADRLDETDGASEPKKRSVRNDFRTLGERFQAERHGDCPAHPARFSLPTTILLFWGYSIAVFSGLTMILAFFYPNYRLEAAVWAGAVVFIAGHFTLLGTFYCKKKFGALVEMAFGSVMRTGIPLAAVLVFYFTIDKILFKMTVITLVVFYMVTLPFEVWVFLPKPKKGIKRSTS